MCYIKSVERDNNKQKGRFFQMMIIKKQTTKQMKQMLAEIEFALKNGFTKVEKTIEKDGSIAFHGSFGYYVVTPEEAKEIDALISKYNPQENENKAVFILGHKEYKRATLEELETMVHSVMNDGITYIGMRYGLKFNSEEEAEKYAESLPKSWKASAYKEEVLFYTEVKDGAFKNASAKSRVKRFLKDMNL